MNKFNVILTSSQNNIIGKDNKLPWNISRDIQYFKDLTSFSPTNKKNIVIMGRNTWESIPILKGNKLANRIPIVISKTLQVNDDPNLLYVACSFDEAIIIAYNLHHNKIWIIGGKSIYIEAFNHYMCGTIYHTKILKEVEGDIELKLPPYRITNIAKENELEFRQLELTGEINYLRLLSKIKYQGDLRHTRNAKTFSLFDETLSFNMNDGFPLLTTKKMYWKGIVEELLFFIRGDTNSKHLEEKKINIWKKNTSQKFINNLKLPYKEGDMGPMYGFMWRHFGTDYKDCHTNYQGKGFDQLTKIVDEIKTNPSSRRILMSNFDPSKAHQGVLYPCHSIILQFYVRDYFLDVKMYQRSVDSFLGEPFNIASTSLLLHIICKLTNKKPGKVTLTFGDCHIYSDHLEQVKCQLKRLSNKLPTIKFPNFETIKDVENSSYDDYIILDYNHHKEIKAVMVV